MNIEELKRHIDISTLEPLNGMKPAYKNSNSIKYGYCPYCGNGKDRLHIYKGADGNQIFHCTKCGQSGNAVQFYSAVHHLTISEAVKELNHIFLSPAIPQPVNNITDKTATTLRDKPKFEPISKYQISASEREKKWIQTANELVNEARDYIFTNNQDARNAREYLHGRGITDDTIRATGIGYRSKSIAETSDCKQYGITIPTYGADGTIQRIKIRFAHEVNGSRYGLLTGSKACALYNADTISALIQAHKAFSLFLCEGELDAILLQEIFSEMNLPMVVGTFGSVDHIPADNQYAKLLAYPTELFIGLDNDSAGKKGARKLWTLRKNCYTLYPSYGNSNGYKDWTDWFINDKQGMMDYFQQYFHPFF